MSQIENKLNIDQLFGNLSKNDLVCSYGITSNGLASLVENIIYEIMRKEKNEYLNNTKNEKSNGNYERKLNISVCL